MLIVLSIFMILATLSLNLYPKYIQKMEMTRFVKQFEEDLIMLKPMPLAMK